MLVNDIWNHDLPQMRDDQKIDFVQENPEKVNE